MPPRPLPWKLLPASQAPGGRSLRQSWWVEWSAFTLILGKEISRKPLFLPARCPGSFFRQARPLGEGACGKARSEEHTSELQSRENLVCRLLLEKKKR